MFNDVIFVDFMFMSGDDNGISDDCYSGVMIGNIWVMFGGLNVVYGGYFFFLYVNVVNCYVVVVMDIFNMGFGLIGGMVNFSCDFIFYKLNGKVGMVMAISNVVLARGGQFMGVEGNFKVGYILGMLMEIEFYGVYLWLGDFYDSFVVNGGEDIWLVDFYIVFVVFKWLMF